MTLKGKLLLQSLRKKQLDWDTCLAEEDTQSWLDIKEDIYSVSDYEIPRCVTIPDEKKGKKCSIVFL